MKRKVPDTPMVRHVRRYLHNTGMKIIDLEREAGLGRYTLNSILNLRDRMGPAVFRALDPIVAFTPEHRKLMKEMYPAGISASNRLRRNREKYERYDPQPWPVTVAKLINNPPVWNWGVV